MQFIHHFFFNRMFMYNDNISVSPCSPNPCLNDGSCTVDVDGKSVCTCNGEWTGCDCSSKYKHGFNFRKSITMYVSVY